MIYFMGECQIEQMHEHSFIPNNDTKDNSKW